ncbi:two-component sensor histidine kinase [Planotetraspora phitsanulokensis]|uniref:histidine kinase n=2 Tax=Planotetraspora phitsanulokensis TaxID=575192 RepID=A0A8J3XJ41_9ACTN|nr:two-component sensor histidine kinase [Planotetraspora phitsanulokensis]
MRVLSALPRVLRSDLLTWVRDPLPPMVGPRWLARLPHVLVALFAIFAAAGAVDGSGPDPRVPLLTMAQAAALVAAMFRPIPAWWTSTVVMVVAAKIVEPPAASWDIPGGAAHRVMSIPWSVQLMALQAGVLFLVALRVRPRVVGETLAISVLTGLACLMLVNPGIGPGQIVLAPPFFVSVTAIGVLVGVGAVLRGERVARTRLFTQEERTAEERARRTVLEERSRIARELHDVVAHHMSLISIQAQVAPHLVKDPPEELKENLAGIRQSAVEALTELRRVLGVLRSEDALEDEARHAPQPTLERLGELAETVRGAGLMLAIETTGEPRRLLPGVELSAFRIIQEALSNAMRHAPGAAVRVQLGYRPDAVTIRVVNAAPDRPAPPSSEPGHGLLGMRERTVMLGGELVAGATPDGGYEVRATLPADAGAPPGEDTT